jgi:hypothetical protein
MGLTSKVQNHFYTWKHIMTLRKEFSLQTQLNYFERWDSYHSTEAICCFLLPFWGLDRTLSTNIARRISDWTRSWTALPEGILSQDGSSRCNRVFSGAWPCSADDDERLPRAYEGSSKAPSTGTSSPTNSRNPVHFGLCEWPAGTPTPIEKLIATKRVKWAYIVGSNERSNGPWGWMETHTRTFCDVN